MDVGAARKSQVPSPKSLNSKSKAIQLQPSEAATLGLSPGSRILVLLRSWGWGLGFGIWGLRRAPLLTSQRSMRYSFVVAKGDADRTAVLQGTLELIVLQTLDTMGLWRAEQP